MAKKANKEPREVLAPAIDCRPSCTCTAHINHVRLQLNADEAAAGVLGAGVLAEAVLIRLGQSYGSTREERAMRLPGDHIVPTPQAVTNHAITIDAPPDFVWPWLVQIGWHRGGWYTARWVDKLLFPLNWPSANRIIPELQHIEIGDFIPDGAPETKCGLTVEELEPGRALALHSTSHLPLSWRDKASLDWSWAFVLLPSMGVSEPASCSGPDG
jgi:hypothetical protein